MLTEYGYVALLLIFAVLFAAVTILIPVFLRFLKISPHRPSPVKNDTYECGMKTIGKTWVQFNVRYYLYALLFITLDVLVVFLYPWAVDLKNLGVVGFIGILIFILLVVVGYVYAWRKKVLEWE